jgi:homocysteine S-methyltransferase
MEGFIPAGYSEHHAITLMRKSVTLACEARDEFKQEHPTDTLQRLVALSLGCYGALLANGAEYTGDYGEVTLDELVRFHRERLDVFLSADAEVDFIMFETVPSFLEAKAIRQVVLEWNHSAKQVAVAFQCRSDDQIADGSPVVNALKVFDDVDSVFAVGINCTKPPFVESLFATIAQVNQESGQSRALLAYPDGGEEWNAVARTWDATTKLPEETFGCMMAKCIEEYGPRVLVGGCCGTGPCHIRNIRQFTKL